MGMRGRLRATLLGSLAIGGLTLTGCTVKPPAYAMIGSKEGGIYGYADTVTPDGGRLVRVVLPATFATPQMAHDFWDRRALEICGHADYRKNIFAAYRPTLRYDHYGGRPGDFNLEGLLYCDGQTVTAADSAQPD